MVILSLKKLWVEINDQTEINLTVIQLVKPQSTAKHCSAVFKFMTGSPEQCH